MSIELMLQIITLILGSWFSYTGFRTLLSKKYYVDEIEETRGESVEDKYKSLPSWRIMFTRYSYGGQWLVFGLGLLTLFFLSLFK